VAESSEQHTNSETEPEPADAGSSNAEGASRFSPMRLLLQVVGFAIGFALFIWCIRRAVTSGEFSALRDASIWQAGMLLVCTFVTIITNGAIFWIIIRPVARLRMRDVQLVNCVVNFANYAPVRLGMLTRIAHHRNVDGLSYFTLIAWYAAAGLIMALTFLAVLLATFIRPAADLWWLLALVALLIIGVAALLYLASHHLLVRRLRGAERMLNHPAHLIAGVILRLIDLLAYGGRLYFSLSILGMSVSFRDWLYLTLLSMLSSLSPVGNIGFREFAISFIGPYLTLPAAERGAIDEELAAAALVDRAGEAILFIPLGIISLIWMIRIWRRTARAKHPG